MPPSTPKVATEDTVEGAGKECTSVADRVTVHYRGTLMNGTEFDSSYKRGKPIEFDLGQLIKGWQEGVPMMRVGETWDFVIPSTIAYGERDRAPGCEENQESERCGGGSRERARALRRRVQ